MGRNDRRSDSSHSAEACCSTYAQKAQHETNDATVKESAILSPVERLSFCGLDEAVNDELVHAIGGSIWWSSSIKADAPESSSRTTTGFDVTSSACSVFRLAERVKAGHRMDGKSSMSIRCVTYASWTVGSLVHGPIAPSIIARGIRSSPV